MHKPNYSEKKPTQSWDGHLPSSSGQELEKETTGFVALSVRYGAEVESIHIHAVM